MLYDVLVLDRIQMLRIEAERERHARAARRATVRVAAAAVPYPEPVPVDSGDLPRGNLAPEPVPAREPTGVGQ